MIRRKNANRCDNNNAVTYKDERKNYCPYNKIKKIDMFSIDYLDTNKPWVLSGKGNNLTLGLSIGGVSILIIIIIIIIIVIVRRKRTKLNLLGDSTKIKNFKIDTSNKLQVINPPLINQPIINQPIINQPINRSFNNLNGIVIKTIPRSLMSII
jgi:hypothetical protein